MKKYEVSEQFIREAFEAACEMWKGKIKKEFPELFEVEPIIGRWYFMDVSGSVSMVNVQGYGNSTSYGVDYRGNWQDGCYFGINQPWSDYKEMTKEEIETMLWKEAEKRGIGKDTKLGESLYFCQNSKNEGSFRAGYSEHMDRLWNIHGVIYEKGKWATPLNENKEIQDKIDSLQKQLDELKLKVK